MRLARVLPLAALLLAVPAPSQALLLDYLTLPGISGEAGPPGPAGSILLDSFSLGNQTFTIVKTVDSTSPALFLAATQGTLFATAQLDRFDTDVSPTQPIQTLLFGDVLVSSVVPFGGGALPHEQVGFAFAEGPFVPEPATAALLAMGCLTLGLGSRRRSA